MTSINAKKELLATSLLAIALAVGLGILSLVLFSGASPNVQIDVFAEKNGAISLSFLPQDQVLLEAHVSSNNASVAGAPVTFEVEMPNRTDFLVNETNTDSLGTANVTFQIPWPSIITSENTGELGTWQTQATVEIHGQKASDITNFTCHIQAPTIYMYTDKGGGGQNTSGGTFYTNETVKVYIEVCDELNHTVPYIPVAFEAVIFGGGLYRTDVNTTDASGIATITNPIIPNVAAKYVDTATASYGGSIVTDNIIISVQLG